MRHCYKLERKELRDLLSATLLRRHNSPGTFAHFRVPRHTDRCQWSGLAGVWRTTSSPAPFGDTLLIPKHGNPSLPAPRSCPSLLCYQQLLLLELPVNPKCCSAVLPAACT